VCLCFLEFCHGIRASLGLIPYGNVQEDAIAIEADSLYMCVLFSILQTFIAAADRGEIVVEISVESLNAGIEH
jgi:hypothetical protein